jgi:dTDP-4-amino-4,6-dideoxygalactose transaminase
MKQIPMFKVAMSLNVDEYLLKVIHSGWIGQGEIVKKFEKQLSGLYDNPRVLSLSAGTHGLSLALRLIGVGVGDEVISTPLTCTATNMPILTHGAKIVWADVKGDFNIDPESIRNSINGMTRAIVIVHWGGYPCDMSEIKQISNEYNIPVIEDCAHVLNATYKDHQIGDTKLSDFAMFSFQAIKHLTAIDGGALCISNDEMYKRGKLLRWYGIDRETERTDSRCEENIKEGGYKFHMNDINATVGLCNISVALENEMKAQDNAWWYESSLIPFDGIEIPQIKNDRKSSYWLFTMLVEKRSDFCTMMASKGISVSRVHERNDIHVCFGESKKDLPGLESVIDKMICIPVGWWVTKEDRDYIVESIKGGW